MNRKNIELEGTKVRLKMIERNVAPGSTDRTSGSGGPDSPVKPIRSTPDLSGTGSTQWVTFEFAGSFK